ncbi:MAG: ImmA/IrrE family metallo-endopeptidase [Thermosipho sp. (in: Bacteria)]|nr:ImmA/IrrE family metallo-endopeptidase [Thermosipho sp. (in: thermotogales)]
MAISQYRILRHLGDKDTDLIEILAQHNIRLSFADLGPQTRGIVYTSRRGRHHVVLNSNLTYEQKQKTFLHELKHILEDFPKHNYIIGFNIQYQHIEKSADIFAEKIATVYGK